MAHKRTKVSCPAVAEDSSISVPDHAPSDLHAISDPYPVSANIPWSVKEEMQLKIVVRVSYQDDKGKQKLMKTTASFSGITSISIEDKKLIVIGEIDPIKLLEKLRKLCNADIGTMGSLEEPKKEKPKKVESKKDEPKKEETEKDPKKQEEKMNKYFVEMAKAYESFNHNRNYTTLYIVHNAEENPNSCVTC